MIHSFQTNRNHNIDLNAVTLTDVQDIIKTTI